MPPLSILLGRDEGIVSVERWIEYIESCIVKKLRIPFKIQHTLLQTPIDVM